IFSAAPTALVMAQTPPPSDQTSPSAASSPHQREATSTNTPEASTTDQTSSSNPSAASTPHQQEATKSTHSASSKQAMKDCIAQKQSENSGMSSADAKKACKAQMKGPG